MTQYLNPPRGGWQGAAPAHASIRQPWSKVTGHRFTALSKGRTARRGEMNKTELRYAAYLDSQQNAGTIVRYWFEPFSLRLSNPPAGQPARYTPDFLILMVDGLTYVDDVKNKKIDDNAAIVRIKVAAELFPLWVFRVVRPDGADWKWTEV